MHIYYKNNFNYKIYIIRLNHFKQELSYYYNKYYYFMHNINDLEK